MKRSPPLLLSALAVSVVWAAYDLYTHAPELLGASRPAGHSFVVYRTYPAPSTPLPSPPADTPRFTFAEVAKDEPEENHTAEFISDNGQITGQLYDVKLGVGGKPREMVGWRGYVVSGPTHHLSRLPLERVITFQTRSGRIRKNTELSMDSGSLLLANDGTYYGCFLTSPDPALLPAERDRVKVLPSLPGAKGVVLENCNDQNQVVGWSRMLSSDGAYEFFFATLWTNNQPKHIGPIVLASEGTMKMGINHAGVVVGAAQRIGPLAASAPSFSHPLPFLYADDKTTWLPLLTNGFEGGACAINDAGDIVGYFSTRDLNINPNDTHAVLWHRDYPFDLNESAPVPKGWVLAYAADINNRGQIVGIARATDGTTRAFVLTPTTQGGAKQGKSQIASHR